jgi:hypothetical protein
VTKPKWCAAWALVVTGAGADADAAIRARRRRCNEQG